MASIGRLGTKERFLKASQRLFSAQGYSGTGLKQVVAAAEAPWGSMYHFFPGGKAQLGAQSVRVAGEQDDALIASVFAHAPNVNGAVRTIFDAEIRRLRASDFSEGCPVASVAADVINTSDDVRAACSAAFAAWESTITAAVAESGVRPADARAFATFMLSALEGATMLARTHKSTTPLRRCAEMVDLTLHGILNDRTFRPQSRPGRRR